MLNMKLLINFFLIITFVVGITSCKKETPQPKYNFIIGKWSYSSLYPIPGRLKNREKSLEKCILFFDEKGIVTITTGDDYSSDSPIRTYKARYYITESRDTFFTYQMKIDFKLNFDHNQKYGDIIRKNFSIFQNSTVNFKYHSRGDYIVDFGEGPRDNDELIVFNDFSDRTFVKNF